MSITRVNDFDGVARNDASLSDARVVDQDVWHTVFFGDFVGVRVHRGLIGDVELVGVCGAAGLVDHRCGLFRGIEVDVGKDDLGAPPREGERRFSSDAASAAGDHQQLSAESRGVLRHFSPSWFVGWVSALLTEG